MSRSDTFKSTAVETIEGQLLYAFGTDDEVSACQVLNNFAKENSFIQLAGGLSNEGALLSAEEHLGQSAFNVEEA
jgi:ribosomal protein L10